MMITEKLRGSLFRSAGVLEHIAEEAAQEIEVLTAENERLRKENRMLEELRKAWQDEASRLKILYNLERLKGR